MKRYVSMLLTVCLFVLPLLSMTASAETSSVNEFVSEEEVLYESTEENYTVNAPGLSIQGIDYFSGMDMVTDLEQMNYRMDISQITFEGDQIKMSAVYQGEDKIQYPLEVSAIAYQTEIVPLKSRGGITAIPVESNMEIISFSLVREANGDLLFPALEHFDGKSIITIVVNPTGSDEYIYFEGLLPDDFVFGSLAKKAVQASDIQNDTKSRNRVRRIIDCTESFSGDLQMDESEIIEMELIQSAELWNVYMQNTDDFPDYDGDSLISMARAPEARESTSRVPLSVFKKNGNWKSTNNPDVPTVGYFAQTYDDKGGPNKLTKVISWEYLYQDPGTLTVDPTKKTGSTGLKTTKLQVIHCGFFWYNAKTGQVQIYSYQRDYRLKGAAVAAGLQANTEILSTARPSAKINRMVWEADWKFFIGLVNKDLGFAANVLDKISVYKEKSEGTKNYALQDTKKKQVDTYGNVVRAVKSSAGDGYLDRSGDHVTVEYVITHPSDITKSTGYKQITSKYYFEVHDKDGLGNFNKRFSVTEYRYTSYLVR